ncbi:MAG: VOC family protein [Acidobacteriia bacterium]|nr:VOC family protein [Terriglobia bacterium]
MEHVIANLLHEFEQGKMNRRQLIQSLAAAATAATAGALPAAAAGNGFLAASINHIMYQVADYARTRDFYSDLMGMKVSGDNGSQCVLTVDKTLVLVRKGTAGTPRIDHIAYTIENWNKDGVEAELKRRGLEPRLDTGGNEESFHVKDPDGYDLQISSGALPRK